MRMGFNMGFAAGAGGGATGATDPISSEPNVLWFYDSKNDKTLVGSAVSSLSDSSPSGLSASQSTAASRPTFSSSGGDRIVFDGTNDDLQRYLGTTATLVTRTQVPDAQGGDVGEGFTNTGLTRAPDGTWWVSNDGRDLDSGGSGTQTASLVHLSADFSTKLDEIDIEGLVSATGSIQGIVYDPLDGTLWYASLAENKVYNITTAGVLNTSKTINLTFEPNGLAIDPVRRIFYIGRFNQAGIREYSLDTGTIIRTIDSGTSNGDQLWWDQDTNLLWQSVDDQTVRVLDVGVTSTTAVAVASYTLTAAIEIEGIYKVGSTLYVCNDAYFHQGPGNDNEILEYTVSQVVGGAVLDRDLLLVGAVRLPVQSGATNAVFDSSQTTGVGVNAHGAISENGVALYFPAGDNVFRMIINSANGTSQRDVISWTLNDVTVDFSFAIAIDYSASTAQLYINGAAFGSAVTLTNLSSEVYPHQLRIGQGLDATGNTDRNLNFEMMSLGAANDLSLRETLDTFIRERHSISA